MAELLHQTLEQELSERNFADKLIVVTAELFHVRPEDFSLVRVGDHAASAIAYDAVQGLYKGNWDRIMDSKNDDQFLVEVDGVQYDTRRGMTLAVYKAMTQEARHRGNRLPDSGGKGMAEGGITSTLLTGEASSRFLAPLAATDGHGRVTESKALRSILGRSREFLFRPAVLWASTRQES